MTNACREDAIVTEVLKIVTITHPEGAFVIKTKEIVTSEAMRMLKSSPVAQLVRALH